MDLQSVTTAILNGELDAGFEAIKEAMKARKEARSSVAFYSFAAGDKIRFAVHTRPAYLAGCTGVVRELRRKKVTVDLDTPVGRFHRGIVTPVDLIEKV